MCVVRRDEPLNLLSGDGGIHEVRSAQAFATQYRKPDLDKTQPGRVHRQEMEDEGPLRMALQPGCDFSGPVRADRIQDQMDGQVRRRLLVKQGQQLAELTRAMLEADHTVYLAIVDPKASQQIDGAIAHILELAACRPTACSWPIGCRRPTGCRRLVRCGWSAYPDTRLFIDTEQWAIRGWAEE